MNGILSSLIDPKSIKDISSLTPPNLVILICSCYSGLGERGTSAFPEYCLWEETDDTSDHWLNRVPGDLHTVVKSTDFLGSVTFSKHLRSAWTRNMTAVYPGCYLALELHWVVLKASSQNHYHLETSWKCQFPALHIVYWTGPCWGRGWWWWWCAVGIQQFIY